MRRLVQSYRYGRLVPASRPSSRLVSCRLVVSSYRLVGTERACGASSSSCHSRPRPRASSSSCIVPPHPVSSCDTSERGRCLSHAVVAFSAVSFPCSSPFVVVRRGRLVAWGMCGNRADKNGAFRSMSSPSRPVCACGLICSCPCGAGDANRAQSNDSETRGRCRSIPDARVVICPQAIFAKRSPCLLIPRPGGGGPFEAGG